jgi:hypothetical protein
MTKGKIQWQKEKYNGKRENTMAKEKIQWQKGKYNGKRKRTKRQTMIYNIIHKELKIEQHESHKKFENELRSLGRISSFYSTSGIRQVTLGKNLVISQTTLRASQNGRSKFF